jgi:hypothetical protein
MRDRPYTLLSCCASIDGYIGSAASRLLLSNEADFDRVDAVRAWSYLETKARRGRHTLELSSVLMSRSSDTTWWNRARLLFRSKSNDQQKGCRCQSDPRAA